VRKPAHQHHIKCRDRKLRIDLRMLRHIPYALPALFSLHAENAQAAGRRLQQPEYKLQQRGLAPAIGPHHADKLACAYAETHILQNGKPVIGKRNLFKLYDCIGVHNFHAGKNWHPDFSTCRRTKTLNHTFIGFALMPVFLR